MHLSALLAQRASLTRKVAGLRDPARSDPSAARRLRFSEAYLEMVEARIDETTGAAD